MRAPRNLETVVRAGLCSGCGLCESMAGRDAVEMSITAAGYIRPRVKKPLDRMLLRRILAVCPGVSVTGVDNRVGAISRPVDTVWGAMHSFHRSWATDPAIRHKGAAGGTLTALGCFLIESGKVDAVLHVRASKTAPMLTDACVSTTVAEIVAGAQSRYGPAAPLVHLNRLLDEGRRIAVIAKPCDLAAVRNLGRIDARIDAQIPYCLTFFCGGSPTLLTAEKIAAYHGVKADEISLFRWRGDGWPGPLRIETKDGRAFEMTYSQAWHDGNVPWTYGSSVQFRCKICPDAEGELADIACPDGWIVENGQRTYREAPGVNIAIARNAKGARLIGEAHAAGYIEIAPFAREELDPMHGDHVRRKLGQPARSLGLFVMWQPGLRVRSYRSLAKFLAAGPRANWSALWGTVRRILAGANREPLP